MPQNDFLPFANTETANVIDQATYTNLPNRGSGFVAGVAQSAQLNKVWRQSSLMSAALAAYIAEQNNADVLDDGNVDKLKNLFASSIKEATKGGVPAGAVIMWSGALDAIPATWALCDGQGGRPDLRDRFVIGAGGAHAQKEAGGSTKIAIEQMPSHTHTGSTSGAGGHSHGVSDPAHLHYSSAGGAPNGGGAGACLSNGQGSGGPQPTQGAGSNVSIQGVGDHAHSMSLNNTGGGQDYLPPFFALAYIIKL